MIFLYCLWKRNIVAVSLILKNMPYSPYMFRSDPYITQTSISRYLIVLTMTQHSYIVNLDNNLDCRKEVINPFTFPRGDAEPD
jgi:hypothetical protein